MAAESSAPPVRDLRSDARRNVEAILAAAQTALAEDPRTSMGEIGVRAGVHRATVHRHFASREDLVAALQERAREECRAVAAELDGPDGVLSDMTCRWVEVAAAYGLTDPDVLPATDDAVLDALRREAAAAEDVDLRCLAVLWAGMVVAGGRLVAAGTRRPDEAGADIQVLLRG